MHWHWSYTKTSTGYLLFLALASICAVVSPGRFLLKGENALVHLREDASDEAELCVKGTVTNEQYTLTVTVIYQSRSAVGEY